VGPESPPQREDGPEEVKPSEGAEPPEESEPSPFEAHSLDSLQHGERYQKDR
jgi:hypothetical protein